MSLSSYETVDYLESPLVIFSCHDGTQPNRSEEISEKRESSSYEQEA